MVAELTAQIPPFATVHIKTFRPGPTLFTAVVGEVGLTILPLPVITVHKP